MTIKTTRFQQLGNDLFWEIYDLETNKLIKWQGYNDRFWWEEVASTTQFQIRGRYKLNPHTNEVEIMDNPQ